MSILVEAQKMVDQLNTTNSMNDKKDILKQYPQCKDILLYTYNPFWKYGVTSKNCLKRNDLEADTNHYDDIFKLLDDLRDGNITGHDAISAVNAFSTANSEFKDLIWLIIDGNLKTRTDAKVINKVWKDLIPSFNVALANKYDDKTKKKVTFDGKWMLSRKLDGIRVVTIIDIAILNNCDNSNTI
jgi:DNA ligase-1